jgi:hypothetical protein
MAATNLDRHTSDWRCEAFILPASSTERNVDHVLSAWRSLHVRSVHLHVGLHCEQRLVSPHQE